jgi:crossover junction endodeoxyribonuclease RuvC
MRNTYSPTTPNWVLPADGPVAVHIGIDPGLDGALAFYEPLRGSLVVVDMPTDAITKRIKGKAKTKRIVSAEGLVRILDAHALRRGRVHATVELVNAMPGQGVTSMFTFGDGAGVIRGVLAALDIPFVRETPQVWKRAVGIPTGADKDASRARAASVFPAYASTFQRKKDDGRADAALLAYFDAIRSIKNDR